MWQSSHVTYLEMAQPKTSRSLTKPSWRARSFQELLVLLAFCVLTSLMTWPWVLHLRDAVADIGDPYMIAWTLWWDFHQTFHDPFHLFNANVFYPYQYTLAFSEHDYGISLLFFPLFALGVRPLTVHSIATFMGFAFCGYGAFRLTRTLTNSCGAAWVGGFVFAFIPYRFHGLGHLHYLFAGWMPLLLESLVLFARVRSWRRAVWLAVAFLMNGLTCITWLILTLAPLALTVLLFITRDPVLRRDRDFWQRGAIAIGLASLLLLPFVLPYYLVSVKYGLKWDDFVAKSPPLMSWLAADRRSKLWAGLGEQVPGGHKLFPGLLAPLLALASLRIRSVLNLLRQGAVISLQPVGLNQSVGVGVVWIVWGFLASLGTKFFPNTLMHEFLLPYRSMHIPSRSVMVCYVGLAVLAGVGAARLAQAASRSRRWVYASLLLVVLVGLTFDLRAFPLHFEKGAVDPDAITLRLKKTPMKGGLVELPSNGCCSRHRYMLRAADHGKPLVNATSSFISPLTDEINRLSTDSPIPASFIEVLEKIPASYLVVHNEEISPLRREDYRSFLADAIAAGRLRFVNRFDNRDDLYAFVKTEPNAHAEAPPPVELEVHDWATLVERDPVNILTAGAEYGRALYRLHLVARGRMPRYDEFMSGVHTTGIGIYPGSATAKADFETRLVGLVRSWEGSAWFVATYRGLDDAQYVARLYENAGIGTTDAERSSLVEALTSRTETRGGALLKVAADPRVEERNHDRSVLLLHYFGFLRRNPDDPPDHNLDGFNFWLSNLKREQDLDQITFAFRDSLEYRRMKYK